MDASQPPDVLERDQALEFLAGRIDYERFWHIPYSQRDFRLDRMRQLLAALGDPQLALPIIHVGGTKGKGSTAAMIAAVLSAAGLRTGLYSSPHLERVEERLRIDGAICPQDEFARLIERVRPAVLAMDAEPTSDDGGSNRPTYFEIITATALLYFARSGVAAAVLEVGLGGRLDSTNVCQPLVSVITSISLDHTQQLGSTLAAIAGEKAGIIKPGVPIVSGVLADEPRQVIAERAAAAGSRLVQLSRDFAYRYRPPRHLELAPATARVDLRGGVDGGAWTLEDVELNLAGDHQAANAAVAVAALTELRALGWKIPEPAIRRGLAGVRWPARIEVLARRPSVVLDAAHNVASIEALVRVLEESFSARRRVLVFATSRDKDARGMLAALLPKFDEVIFTRYESNPRFLAPETLLELAAELSPAASPRVSANAAEAWRAAQELAGADDLVAITGSFFIAAEMQAAIESPGG